MRDRDSYGQDRGRFGREDRDDDSDRDGRPLSDEDRRWRGQGAVRAGQRYPEQTHGSRSHAQSGGSGQREAADRGEFGGYGGGGYGAGGYGGEGYRGGGHEGGAQRPYGREQGAGREWNREWSPGSDVGREDRSSFGSSGYGQQHSEGRGASTGTGYYGQRMDRPSERNYGVGYGGYGEEHGHDDDRGLLERAGDWLQRKLGNAPKGYRRSDERIREDVCDLIMRRGDIDASDVTVEVHEAEVTFTGTVRDRHSKRRLEDLADDVLGVNEVHNQVKVRRENEGATLTSSSASAPRSGESNLGVRPTTGTADKSTRPSS